MKNMDLNQQNKTADFSGKLPMHLHLLALSCAAFFTIVILALPIDDRNNRIGDEKGVSGKDQQFTLPLPEPSETELSSNDQEDKLDFDHWRTAIVRPGDSLYLIFSRLGLKTEDLYTLISSTEEAKRLEQLHPGDIFKIRTDTEGDLLELVHQMDQIQGLRIIREGDIFKTSQFTQETEKRTAFSTGIITNSLYQSALEAGMSDRLIMEFAEIFGWDIDFAHDIHRGDSFSVIFEEDYVAGEKLGDGNILAAEFIHRGKTYRTIRYTNPLGNTHYYTPEGRAMRQAFLRSPVDFRRISSHFRPQRWHPVLGVKRPHKGVDYAAPTGTPIKASGDGIVAFIGKKGGYGNTIILQHDQRYTTLYAHMSGFTKGLRRGERVKQGDIIGYVGMTGLATGPHLHYEFRVDGVHMNPVTVKLPGAPPLDRNYLADFRKKTTHLIAQLDIYSRTRLAMNTRR